MPSRARISSLPAPPSSDVAADAAVEDVVAVLHEALEVAADAVVVRVALEEVVPVAAEDVLDVRVDVAERADAAVVRDVVESHLNGLAVVVVLVGDLVGARAAADVVAVRPVAGEETVAARPAVERVRAVVAADPDLVARPAEQRVVTRRRSSS